jgi:protein-tyrosine phosphatase
LSELFSILAVCRANVARSYFAERFLVAALAERGVSETEITVSSRGTHVSRLVESTPDIDDVLQTLRVAPREHSPTQVSRADLESADLILVADENLEDSLVDIFPGSSDVTFTIRQFARLTTELEPGLLTHSSDETPEGRAKELSRQVGIFNRYRGFLLPDAESLDIADPAGQARPVLEATARTIHASTETIANWCVAR